MNSPNIGDELYIGSSLYVSHGRDDIKGGVAVINSIYESEHLPKDHVNYFMVGFDGLPDSNRWNWRLLMKEQTKLKGIYSNQNAKPDPDYSTASNPPNYGWV